jgi:PAS domain S-box-containing protein
MIKLIKKIPGLNSVIGRKFILYILLFSSVITFVGTGIQLYLDFDRDLEEIHITLKLVELSYLKSITNSLWITDNELLQIQLEGISQLPNIELVEVREGAKVIQSVGTQQSKNFIERTVPLLYVYNGQNMLLGKLHVVASLENIYARIFDRVLVIFFIQTIKTFLVSLFIFIIFHKLVGKFIVKMSSIVESVNLESMDKPLTLNQKSNRKKPDEIDQLLISYNRMRENLAQDIVLIKETSALLSQSEQELRIRDQINNIFLTIPDKEMYGEVLKIVLEVMHSKYGVFGYIDQKESLVIPSMTREIWDECLVTHKDIIFPYDSWGDSIWPRAIRQKKLLYSNTLSENTPEGHLPITRNIAMPIVHNDIVVGLIQVGNKDTDYTKRDIQLLETIGKTITTVLNARLQRDIQKNKFSQSEENRRRLELAVEQSDEIIIITDEDGKIQYINPAFEHITGFLREEVIGQKPSILKSGKQDDALYANLWSTILTGKTWKGHIINKKKDGTLYDEDATISPVKNSDGKITNYVAIKHDVTSELKLQEQLWQSQKMESIGTLAGGIAHDFNNILGGILGYTELAQDDAGQDSPVQESLAGILKSTTRARDLVKQILTFSRKSHEERKPIQLSTIVKEAAKLIRSTIPTTIEIRQNIDEKTGLVNADSTQMHQIVMNLCTNSAHAMEGTEGVLEIVLSPIDITQESMIKYQDISPGPFVKLLISDTGTGINPRIIYRIFEPFFTTKEKGEGTGLGLSVVHGIIKDHGGDISLESQLGKGTTFTILLPRIIAEPDKEKDTEPEIPTGNEHILFVDDEKVLMDLSKKILESLGYTVTTMNSSIEALETFQKSPDTFDLVITDQTMPHMTGYNLAKRILGIKPSVNIILCTGYSETITPEKTETAGIKALIYKPISKKEIAQKIRGVLDKHNHT